jgi:hypothetical protein
LNITSAATREDATTTAHHGRRALFSSSSLLFSSSAAQQHRGTATDRAPRQRTLGAVRLAKAMAEAIPDPPPSRFQPSSSILFVCDIQERFRGLIYNMAHVIHSATLLNEAAHILGIPVIVTEQYPKALLKTVTEIDVSRENTIVFEKTLFSMLIPVGTLAV